MKKIVTLSVLLFAICIFYWACKKDQTTNNKNLTTEEQELIANAKTYFENNVQNTIQSKRLSDVTDTTPGQFNPLRSLLKSADWSNAYTIKLSIGKIVVAPIKFGDSLFARPANTDSTTRLSINNLVKLIVYKDSAKQLHVEVVTAFPDSNFLNNPTGAFSGIAFVQDWQGNFLRAYNYSQGTVTQLSLSENVNDNVSTNSVRSPDLVAIVTCFSMSYTSCAGTDDDPYQECTYFTQNLGCITTSTGNGGGDGAPTSGDYGNVAHAGSSPTVNAPSFSSVDSITNSLINPCFQSVLNTLEQKGLKNDITNILLNTFGVNDRINIEYEEADTTSDGSDALTVPQGGGGTSSGALCFVTTTLSDRQLAHASKEFIAETMFHEILHGYLDVNSKVRLELLQHIVMINSYVNSEVSALQEIFPNLSTHDAQCLVLGGFGNIQDNDPTTLNSVLSAYHLTSNDVANTNNSYKTGSTGTACGTKSSIAP